jgi:hypothetical protein
MFLGRRIRGTRVVGALTGGGLGVLLLGLTAVNSEPDLGAGQYSYGLAVLVLGGALGWASGPRAARPGLLNAAGTAGRITLIAVPLGAVLVVLLSFGLQIFTPDPFAYVVTSDLPGAIAGVLGLAFFGLVLLGLPMAGLTFVAASIWVFLVRAALAGLRVARHRFGVGDSGPT